MSPEEITCDENNLYEAALKTIKSSPSKESTKRFSHNRLEYIARAQKELHDRTWKITKLKPFIINERGHTRKIEGNCPYDRMIIHSYIDNALEPLLRPHIIYDNYASQVGKGTSLARKRFKDYLHWMYRKTGSNKFYIMLIDFSKFYDNVQHKKLYDEIMKVIPYDKFHEYMIKTILDSFKVDVSFMSDEEYENCLETKYVALEHLCEKDFGDKYMEKSLSIGNQGSQIFSIFYPSRADKYCKIVRRLKAYGRYMDDTYIMCDSKDDLKEIFNELCSIYNDLGLFVNEKKTQIYMADRNLKFLNRIYRVTSSGHVIENLSTETLTRQRRKLKKFAKLVDDGRMDYKRVENQYKAWIGVNYKLMSSIQRDNFNSLYNKLFINDWLINY